MLQCTEHADTQSLPFALGIIFVSLQAFIGCQCPPLSCQVVFGRGVGFATPCCDMSALEGNSFSQLLGGVAWFEAWVMLTIRQATQLTPSLGSIARPNWAKKTQHGGFGHIIDSNGLSFLCHGLASPALTS